jgi:uncharacterized protein YndB with AHSA1/START domain
MGQTGAVNRVVGQTRDVGFEIGVSRTLPRPPAEVWRFLVSPAGVATWLGEGARLGTAKGQPYETADGTSGEIRSFSDLERVRLTWRPRDWTHDTTLQVAIFGSGDRTSVRFHQERLADAAERNEQRGHRQAVLTKVAGALVAQTEVTPP